ncbi:hypothetical protein BDW59DRAFT_177581 [Aspergillus cavernicola]|uniref:Amidohydrolase-related domain-containing protein n=1 Tax=Aspergillus cavernicola TaxID=176166 RepID=A0ABR4ISZ6_9EURO
MGLGRFLLEGDLKNPITYSVAKEREDNVLHQLQYYDARESFFSHLNENTDWIQRVITLHLHLGPLDRCHVAEMKEWISGSFNVCIPVIINCWIWPGNGDEKVLCEAGAYAWLQEHCPDVPIPYRLFGQGTATS